MNSRIVWMNREEMLMRGRRVALAHWRNKLESECLETWFNRNYARYCKFVTGKNIKPNTRSALAKRFWTDVFKELEKG